MPEGVTTPNNGLLVSTLPISEANVTNLTTDLAALQTGTAGVLRVAGPFTVSAAQILAFDGTGGTNVQLMASPGASAAIQIVQALVVLRAGNVAFNDPGFGSGNIVLGTFGTTGALLENAIKPQLMTQTVDQASLVFIQSSGGPLTEFKNCPVVANDDGGDYTVGNGHLEITLLYHLATV